MGEADYVMGSRLMGTIKEMKRLSNAFKSLVALEGGYRLSSYRVTLLVSPYKVEPQVQEDLAACGIVLEPMEKASLLSDLDGLLITKALDDAAFLESGILHLSKTPGLLLVYGEDIPYGYADTLVDAYARQGSWEVVRMTLVCSGERALLGGKPNGVWVRDLCRRLAHHHLQSMVCQMREVDEVIRQLPRYLAWKERFFFELGEVCDSEHISLQRVARAMGMDTRIGQQWMYPERRDYGQVCWWLERECRHVLEKTNVERITIWGPLILWKQMPTGWLTTKEVYLYTWEDEPIPNEDFPDWTICNQWEKSLENADLLVIGGVDIVLSELPLYQLARLMRQAVVVDAAACFPIQEAQAYLKSYRAVGEKTNV
ncbi:hypothetical protein [Brevibacillus sp. NRS-1366]|uniref:hypothetical protein n=1 Tax=Brevibacillus sp. NRS-1366 TaxID=3233899 RepID=UPI003D1E532B